MLIVLTGPASSGKDTILAKLLEKYPQMKRVVTTTTRFQRPGEVEGKDYHFVTRSQFEQMIKDGKFIEYVHFFGNLYGTTKKALEPLTSGKDLIWRVEISRAAQIKELFSQKLGIKTLVLYIDVPDWKILEVRMRKRGTPDDKIKERLEKDKEDFKKYGSKFTNVIYNAEGKLDETVEKIINLVHLEGGLH